MLNDKIILKNDVDVEQRLKEFDVNKEELQQIALQAANAKLNAVPNDAKIAAGSRMYLDGTRALRDVFLKKKGWIKTDNYNIALVEHLDKRLKVMFQTVDHACDLIRPPHLLHSKNSEAEKLVFDGQFDLFDSRKKEYIPKNHEMWYLCVSVEDHLEFVDVRAELSRPKPLIKGHFSGFYERIFIVQKDQDSFLNRMKTEESSSKDIDVNVTRKRKTV